MRLESIQNDYRGSIDILTGSLDTIPEVTIFKTKAGYARGGCIHDIHDEFVCVIEGAIEYVCYTPTGMSRLKLYSGDRMRIIKGTPHYFLSLSDSVVLEWGASIEEKQCKHKDFRKMVDEINSKKLASDML